MALDHSLDEIQVNAFSRIGGGQTKFQKICNLLMECSVNSESGENEEDKEEEKMQEMPTISNASVFRHVTSTTSSNNSSTRPLRDVDSPSPPTQQELSSFSEGEKRQRLSNNKNAEEEEEDELRDSLENVTISPSSSPPTNGIPGSSTDFPIYDTLTSNPTLQENVNPLTRELNLSRFAYGGKRQKS